MIRAVRDKRFKYMRNYRPDLPYLLWIPYRNKHPIVQEMWRLHMAGELDEAQSLMFRYPRSVEELYDTEADPHEIKNLAGDQAYSKDLQRLRDALDAWIDDVGDMGEIPEAEMVQRWKPGGEKPKTAAPLFVPICEESPGIEGAPNGGTFTAPVLLQMHSATQGASIAYTFEEGEAPRRRLYTEPLRLAEGTTRVRALATRIGFPESEESVATFEVCKPR